MMGMFFTYNIKECDDYRNCKLNKRRGKRGDKRGDTREMSIGKITKTDPNHWHLIPNEGPDWVYKSMDACLAQLCSEVRTSYKKIYPKGELS